MQANSPLGKATDTPLQGTVILINIIFLEGVWFNTIYEYFSEFEILKFNAAFGPN